MCSSDLAAESISFILALMFTFSTLFTILAPTILIKFSSVISPAISLAFSLVGTVSLVATHWAVILGSRCYKQSVLCLRERRKSHGSKYQKRFLKSCPTLQAQVGHFFPIKSSVFFLEIVSFEAANIVNLLVMTRKVVIGI